LSTPYHAKKPSVSRNGLAAILNVPVENLRDYISGNVRACAARERIQEPA
jgi:hypothetical protein